MKYIGITAFMLIFMALNWPEHTGAKVGTFLRAVSAAMQSAQ